MDKVRMKNIENTAEVDLINQYYEKGKELEMAGDMVEAVKWYRKAAEQGDEVGQFALGCCYMLGYGVEQDDEEAARWFGEASRDGILASELGHKILIHQKK